MLTNYIELNRRCNVLKGYCEDLKKESVQIKRRLNELPRATLEICDNNGYSQWHVRTRDPRMIAAIRAKGWRELKRWKDSDGAEHVVAYIPKAEVRFAERLAERRALEMRLRAISGLLPQIEIATAELNNLIKALNVLGESRAVAELLNRSFLPKLNYWNQWASAKYLHNTDFKDELIHLTNSGFYVRSKSEKLIADKLVEAGLPFLYEPLLKANGNKHYPDFFIVNPITGKGYVWEHNGRMDEPKYILKVAKRLRDYSFRGFLLNEDLFFTCETKTYPLSEETVLQTISKILTDDGSYRNAQFNISEWFKEITVEEQLRSAETDGRNNSQENTLAQSA